MERWQSFGAGADEYDRARPDYPDEVIDRIVMACGLKPGDRLLEIGAGTGKATLPFAKKGFAVHCVEPSPGMAGRLAVNLHEYELVSIEIAAFENRKKDPADGYHMVFAATSFHWLDPAVRYEQCAGALKENGFLVQLYNKPFYEGNPFVDRAFSILGRYSAAVPAYSDKAKSIAAHRITLDEIDLSKHFRLFDDFSHRWHIDQTAGRLITGLVSHSAFLVLPAGEKEKCLDELNAAFPDKNANCPTMMETIVYIAQKV
jgi:SAM-dependent methyltransferase